MKIQDSTLWKKIFLLLLPVVLWLCGCQSTASLERHWLGRSKTSLVEAWGPPSNVQQSPEGGTIYVYTRTYYPPYQESMSPTDPTLYRPSRETNDYPIQVKAESSTAKFWITPEGTIYRVQGRIIE